MIAAGLDFGTQSVKLIVYDSEKRKELASASHPFRLISRDDGSREQMAEWWIEGLCACFAAIPLDIRKSIKGIGVSGQQHGFVPLSSDGTVLAPVKLWCDTSTASECDELTAAYGGRDRLIGNVGNAILPGYTASKILAFRKNSPELYARMAHVMLPHDYINYWLTGSVTMERGDASGTALYNIYKNCWDDELCSLISPDLISRLPDVSDSKGLAGYVRREAADMLGLGYDVAVSAGGGDNMMSAIGTGTVREGRLTMSLGTSGTLFAFSETPVVDSKCRLAGFASSSGGYLPLLCTMNCTVASELMRDLMELSVSSFDELAATAPIGSEGLVMLPFFNGERVPNYPRGEGVLAGMNMSNVKKVNIARAALEGVSFEFLLGIEAFRESGFRAGEISLTGGGSKSSIWRSIIADLTGLRVRVPSVKEAAAFGGVLQVLSVLEHKDIADIADEYIEFDDSKEALPALDKNTEYIKAYQKWRSYSDSLGGLYE